MDFSFLSIGFVAVVGGFAYAFYEQYTKTKVKLSQNAVKGEDIKAELEALKQRVAALETIVTDKSYDLKREIETL